MVARFLKAHTIYLGLTIFETVSVASLIPNVPGLILYNFVRTDII